MSVENFRKYYEDSHRIIGEKYLEGFAIKYIGRYTNPLLDRSGNLNNPEFDVLLEIW